MHRDKSTIVSNCIVLYCIIFKQCARDLSVHRTVTNANNAKVARALANIALAKQLTNAITVKVENALAYF